RSLPIIGLLDPRTWSVSATRSWFGSSRSTSKAGSICLGARSSKGPQRGPEGLLRVRLSVAVRIVDRIAAPTVDPGAHHLATDGRWAAAPPSERRRADPIPASVVPMLKAAEMAIVCCWVLVYVM